MAIFKTYGASRYKGFVLLRNPKTNKLTKHYISAVDPDYVNKGKVYLYFRGGNSTHTSDGVCNYTVGNNKKVDIGIKTWVKERKRQKMRVSNDLPKSCYSYLGKKRKYKKVY